MQGDSALPGARLRWVSYDRDTLLHSVFRRPALQPVFQVRCTALHHHQILYHRLIAFLVTHGAGMRTSQQYAQFAARDDEHVDHAGSRWWILQRDLLVPTPGHVNRSLRFSRP